MGFSLFLPTSSACLPLLLKVFQLLSRWRLQSLHMSAFIKKMLCNCPDEISAILKTFKNTVMESFETV